MGENKYFILGVIAVVLVAGVLIYATGNYGKMTGSSVFNLEDKDVKTYHIQVSQYGYDPYEIVVKKDDKVRFFLKSTDYPHNLNLPDFGLKIDSVDVGELGQGEFVANRAGEFSFYDNAHAYGSEEQDEAGIITGTLIVLP